MFASGSGRLPSLNLSDLHPHLQLSKHLATASTLPIALDWLTSPGPHRRRNRGDFLEPRFVSVQLHLLTACSSLLILLNSHRA